jgi:4-amino-4-deoxy-L-arabinose transferase-like glycosyltransferase
VARPAHRRRLHPLLVLCVTYTLLALAHGAATPVFEAPDEVWHYAYVRWVAEGHGLPPLTDGRSGANQEAAQPPLYYGLAALLSRRFDDDDLPAVLWHNPGFGHQASTTSTDNKNMLVHPGDQAVNWQGAVLAIHVTRLTSWLFGLLAVCAAWGLGMEAFASREWALVTAALVAFHPQFVFISGVVNNDGAAAAVAGLALWLGAAIVRRGTSWRRVVAAGLVAGLAALTKMSLLPVAPYLAVCLVGSALLHARTTGVASFSGGRRTYLTRQAGYLAGFTTLTVSTGGWWYLRNLRHVGDLLGLQHHTTTLWGRPEPARWVDLLAELPVLFRSFWGAYGWGHVTWPSSIYVILALLTLPPLGLALAVIGRAWLTGIRRWTRRDQVHLGSLLQDAAPAGEGLLAGLLSAVWLGGITFALLRWMLLVEAPHGRLLFPALTAWALLVALGLR